MTIANGNFILKADLDAMTTTSLASIATNAAQLPLEGVASWSWPGITAALCGSNPERCRAVWTAPDDLLLETCAVVFGELDNPSTVTVRVSCPGVLDAFPLVVTGPAAVASGTTGLLPRLLFDNVGKGPLKALRTIPRGATVQIDVSTTSTAAAGWIQVALPYRAFFGVT